MLCHDDDLPNWVKARLAQNIQRKCSFVCLVPNEKVYDRIFNLLNSYTFYVKYLSSDFLIYRFLLLNLKNVKEGATENDEDWRLYDSSFLSKVSYIFNQNFVNLSSLESFLKNNDDVCIVLCSYDKSETFLRALLSYNYILGNKIMYILCTNNRNLSLLDWDVWQDIIDLSFLALDNDTADTQKFSNFSNTSLLRVDSKKTDEERLPFWWHKVFESICKWNNKVSEHQHGNYLKNNNENNIGGRISLGEFNSQSSDTKVETQFGVVGNNQDGSIYIKTSEYNVKPTEFIKKNSDVSQVLKTNNFINLISNSFTEREKKVLETLSQYKQLSKEEIKNILWPSKKVKDNTLDQFISRLKRKLAKKGYSSDIISTIKGYGIRLNISSL